MREITVIHIALVAGAAIFGIVLGWLVRSNRTASEKAAINAGWQEQIEAQRTEHERLLDQNKSLMEQNSQYQASNKDAKMRAGELAAALKEAFERRDELQRQMKDIRSNLETAISERDQLQSKARKSDGAAEELRQRDDKIRSLTRELGNWQDRLPPLIDRYRQRNEEAQELGLELAAARKRIADLEATLGSEETRIEPVDRNSLGDALDASNEPLDTNAGALTAAGALVAEDEDEDLVADAYDDENPAADFDAGGDDDVTGSAPSNRTDGDTVHAPGRLQRDDLKLIKGIGPAIEKTLNEMGIFRFDQIAEMSEYDIDRVAHRLKGFRSRIYREDWMGQARELQLEKASG